jgi:hypothetical protein
VSRWILNNVPSWLQLLALIVLFAGGAMLILLYVRHRFPRLREGAHNEGTTVVYRIAALVFAFFTGFVVSALWGEINAADSVARIEGAAGVQLASDLIEFDKADTDRIRQSLLEYERAAEAEWPIAANGDFFPEANHDLERVYAAYKEVQPRNDTQKMFLATSFANLDKLKEARAQRVILARTEVGPPSSVWAVIFLTGGLLLGCCIVYGIEKPTAHYAMVAAVGALIATLVFLVLQLSYPFIGEIGTSPEALREVIRVLSSPTA